MRILFLFFILIHSFSAAFAQGTVFDTWKTVDDETGEAKSYVEIYEEDGKVYGKITGLLSADSTALCDACRGDRKNKPILGMKIIEGLEKDDDVYEGGKILDPESGKTYNCKIWLSEDDPNTLKVRGIHWTGFYRTQRWKRVKK